MTEHQGEYTVNVHYIDGGRRAPLPYPDLDTAPEYPEVAVEGHTAAATGDAAIVALVEELLERLAHWRAEAAYHDESYEMTTADKVVFVAPYRARLRAALGH